MKQDKDIAKEFSGSLRQKLGDRLKQVILYGSRARGDAREGSDYDVLVIVEEKTAAVRELVLDADVEMMDKHGTLFSAVIYSQDEWEASQEYPLAWNIRNEGIPV